MILIKALLIGTAISFVLVYIADKLSQYLDGKPKDNKFRQWWSKHICDLDNKY
jgi:hypothetical protein